jgi:hypothetical protein
VLTADAACLAALFCCPDVVIGCDGALDDFCTVERRCAGQSTSTPAAEPVSTPADHDHHDHTIITIEINNIIIAYALLGLAAAAFLVCFCASASLCCFAHRSPRNICCKQSAKKAKKVAVEGLEGDPPPPARPKPVKKAKAKPRPKPKPKPKLTPKKKAPPPKPKEKPPIEAHEPVEDRLRKVCNGHCRTLHTPRIFVINFKFSLTRNT